MQVIIGNGAITIERERMDIAYNYKTLITPRSYHEPGGFETEFFVNFVVLYSPNGEPVETITGRAKDHWAILRADDILEELHEKGVNLSDPESEWNVQGVAKRGFLK